MSSRRTYSLFSFAGAVAVCLVRVVALPVIFVSCLILARNPQAAGAST